MNILIIDNDQNMIDKLKRDLYNYFCEFYKEINFYSYSSNFLDCNFKKNYDYAFIDIDLHKEYSGIDIAFHIVESHPDVSIIFVSAHNKYIHDALITSPFYFIRKAFYSKDIQVFFSMIEHRVQINQTLNLKYKCENSRINMNKIIMIEGQVHKLTLTSVDKAYYDNRSLKEILTLLPEDKFVQIHKSYIINLDYLLEYKSNKVKLSNGTEINVGRTCKDNFNQILKEYLIKWVPSW